MQLNDAQQVGEYIQSVIDGGIRHASLISGLHSAQNDYFLKDTFVYSDGTPVPVSNCYQMHLSFNDAEDFARLFSQIAIQSNYRVVCFPHGHGRHLSVDPAYMPEELGVVVGRAVNMPMREYYGVWFTVVVNCERPVTRKVDTPKSVTDYIAASQGVRSDYDDAARNFRSDGMGSATTYTTHTAQIEVGPALRTETIYINLCIEAHVDVRTAVETCHELPIAEHIATHLTDSLQLPYGVRDIPLIKFTPDNFVRLFGREGKDCAYVMVDSQIPDKVNADMYRGLLQSELQLAAKKLFERYAAVTSPSIGKGPRDVDFT